MGEVSGPVFIGGDGRSGTTLLSVMLDSHPDMVCLPELHFNGDMNLGEDVLSGANKPFIVRCERAGISPARLRMLVDGQPEFWKGETFEERADLIRHLGWAQVNTSPGKKCWGMKIMREIRNPRRYLEEFPGAKFVCLVRDPRDVFASQRQWPSWGYTNAIEAGNGWLSILKDVDAEEGPFVWIQKYESLIEEPERMMRGILEYLGLPWSDEVLKHADHEHALTSSRVSHYSKDQVRKPINNSSIGRWKEDLMPLDVIALEKICGELMDFWGYERCG